MSNIYIQEPPTSGKVLLETTVGDIDIELWSREAPKACRNFVQLCLEGYYDNTIFHRIVKGFIAQGGDPSGTGEGGESIYGKPFKDEFHSRIRFVRRGLVAMANGGKDDNGSQFFFTFAACPELQKKHTIFGKVAGNTIYNMIKLENALVDGNDRPVYPSKVLRTKVLNNPFPDIVPRVLKKSEETDEKKDEKAIKATKDFKLLSFGDEAEEDEEEINEISKEYRGKSKSSHDLIDDPHLSSVPAVEAEEENRGLKQTDDEENQDEKNAKIESVRKKLMMDKQEVKQVESNEAKHATVDDDEDDENQPTRIIKAFRDEYKRLKREMAAKKLNKNKPVSENTSATKDVEDDVPTVVKSYYKDLEKYEDMKTTKKKKMTDNESRTLAALAKFQAKLQSAKEIWTENTDMEKEMKEMDDSVEDEDEYNDAKWMANVLHFESHEAKVKDANMKDEDTYEIFDPRNPINQRRREASKQAMRKKR